MLIATIVIGFMIAVYSYFLASEFLTKPASVVVAFLITAFYALIMFLVTKLVMITV